MSSRYILEQALQSERGIIITLDTPREAHSLRNRLFRYRSFERRQNLKRYPSDHPMSGASAYDSLVFEIIRPDGSVHNPARGKLPPDAIRLRITHTGSDFAASGLRIEKL